MQDELKLIGVITFVLIPIYFAIKLRDKIKNLKR